MARKHKSRKRKTRKLGVFSGYAKHARKLRSGKVFVRPYHVAGHYRKKKS